MDKTFYQEGVSNISVLWFGAVIGRALPFGSGAYIATSIIMFRCDASVDVSAYVGMKYEIKITDIKKPRTLRSRKRTASVPGNKIAEIFVRV